MNKEFYDEFLEGLSQEDRAEVLSLAHKQFTIMPPEPVMDQLDEGGEFQIMTERYDVIYKCVCCGEEIFMDNYCSKCGQRIK